MRTPPHIMLLLLFSALLAGCTIQSPRATTGVTFIVVRHAEKVHDASSDPPLTQAGQARAEALATWLIGEPLQAVYATAFQRTQQTAAPTARRHALQVIAYDAKQPAGIFAAQLLQMHRTGTVLVVGHSNTVPGIAAALCDCDVAPMEDTEYGRRMTIRIAPDRAARLTITRDP